MSTADRQIRCCIYARVSTEDQNLDLQRDALTRAGCTRVYEDRMSGAKAARPGLRLALEVARVGDQGLARSNGTRIFVA